MSKIVGVRARRTRRVNISESDDEDIFQYKEGDLTTVETVGGLDLEFRIRVLSDLLICSLCNGFFRDAMTIKECLHTFCRSCIVLQINHGLDSCPICLCRISVYLDDSIQRDVTIQNLVDKLFPHFSKEELIEKSDLYKLIGIAENPSFDLTSSPSYQSSLLTPANLTQASCGWDGTDEWIKKVAQPGQFRIDKHHSIQLALHPDSSTLSGFKLPKPYIRTSHQIQVQKLAAYIASKLGLDSNQIKVELLIEGQVLAHSHTLDFVCRSRRLNTQSCIPILFRLVATEV